MYRRSLEGKEREEYEKKKKIKDALDSGKPIPTELRDDASNLENLIAFDDTQHFVDPNNMDSEYARSGFYDPKLMVTSSRNPSSRLIQFVKEVNLLFPGARRMNRGGHKIVDLVNACRKNGYTDLVVVHETRGIPDGIIISHLPYGPSAFFGLYNVVTRHDIEGGMPTMSTEYPHLIFNNLTTKLGIRLQTILKNLFPAPKEESNRVITFSNENDFLSFRHHNYKKNKDKVELTEVGPRFEMRLYKILLGTLEMKEAETEWTLHAYLNTGKRKNYL
jgi:U3 small nucleolar ribonucleoprotein protein IMP4